MDISVNHYYYRLCEIERLTFEGKMSGIERSRMEQELYKLAQLEGITADEFAELSRKAYHREKPKNPQIFVANSD
jgi:hypothetical protein